MKAFNSRIYYKLNLTLDSPMTVGRGSSESTDHDVFTDSNGVPVIPATSIAGSMRSYVFHQLSSEKDLANELFGSIEGDGIDSKLRVYDARVVSDNPVTFITSRDCVKLKDKVGVKGAKFDLQVVETGAKFVSYIELLDATYQDVLEKAISAMDLGLIRFGAKTTRGFGKVKVNADRKRIDTIEDWLSFRMFHDDSWTGSEFDLDLSAGIGESITINLKNTAGLSIREYSTKIGMPDYKTLSLKSQLETYTPVIPGTSWAGVFRDRCSDMLEEDALKELFGDVDEKSSKAIRSKLYFSESVLSGGTVKDISRNSIDRFSAATKRGALYTERTYFGGKTNLEITCPTSIGFTELFALGVCLADLHNGFISVGGLTAVGRGLFEIESIFIGDKDVTQYIVTDTPDIKKFAEEVMIYEA